MPDLTEARPVTTPRLTTRVLFSGPEDGVPVLFVHGNLSSATWWEEVMARLPAGYRGIAPDLRGYGGADPAAKVDATRGMGDFCDDLAALMMALGLDRAHLVGHSMGGGILWPFLAEHPGKVRSLAQVCPSSPYGFGGSTLDGSPCFADGAGSGAGAVNADFARLLAEGARGGETAAHPRTILNSFVWKPPFVPGRIEAIVDGALAQHSGEQDYPGDMTASPNWPGTAPGRFGPINAMARLNQAAPLGFVGKGAAPILWLRGADDQIVADNSMFDLGALGKLGAVPGWPGDAVFPPQPMIAQTEAALAAHEAAGGTVTRVVIDDCGHSPYLEQPEAFDAALHAHLGAA